MKNIQKTLSRLCSFMTVSGFEHRESDNILTMLSDFGEAGRDRFGNYIVEKKCKKENAPTLVIDAHIDEIGFVVTKLLDDGFLSVTSVGGLDAHVMQSAELEIYGKEKVYGVVGSTPPHLRLSGADEKLPKIEQLLVDTGLSQEESASVIPVGSVARFKSELKSLANDVVCGSSLDNKICCACALQTLARLDEDDMCFNVCVLLSLREEIGGYAGARTGVFSLSPDLVVSLDVNFASAPETRPEESAKRGGGYTVSLSAVTDRAFTKRILALSRQTGLPHRVIAEPNDVGMNANAISLCMTGIVCADLGIPLTSMHTPVESASLRDCDSLCRLLCALACDDTLAKEYSK